MVHQGSCTIVHTQKQPSLLQSDTGGSILLEMFPLAECAAIFLCLPPVPAPDNRSPENGIYEQ